LFSLATTKNKFHIIKEDWNQGIMSFDLGFSSFRNLLDDGTRDVHSYHSISKIMALFRNASNIFETFELFKGLRISISKKNNDLYKEQRIAIAKKNSWESRFNGISKIIQDELYHIENKQIKIGSR